MLTMLVFLSGFLLSATAAYYSVIGLIAIFPGAMIAIIAMGAALELSKLVAASWLYRNWNTIPKMIKFYMSSAVVLLMIITSMGIFGFLSKSHIEHQVMSTSDNTAKIETLNSTISSREKSILLIERQLNNIDSSVQKYIENDSVTKGLQQKRALNNERKQLEAERKEIETELIGLKTERSAIDTDIRKQEVEVGPLKYIAELVYGQDAKDHFDSAVRMVIVLLIVVFDPLAVALLIAGNISLKVNELPKPVEIRQKRKYTRRKPLPNSTPQVHEVQAEDFGIQPINKPLK